MKSVKNYINTVNNNAAINKAFTFDVRNEVGSTVDVAWTLAWNRIGAQIRNLRGDWR